VKKVSSEEEKGEEEKRRSRKIRGIRGRRW
jgi:hypothetical protein